MLMTCIRTDQSTLDASVSHRFEVNALIGENIQDLNNWSTKVLSRAIGKEKLFFHSIKGLKTNKQINKQQPTIGPISARHS